jgi:glycerol-3-phosphate dehydrogenase
MDERAVAHLSPADRGGAVEQLGARTFDLLVIGGGIVGAGIAEAASAHGLDVALVDRADFAGATSSASSKLIHGGLRYLQMGDVRLVREAHQERRYLMNVVAPHLVERLPFLFPLYQNGPHRPIVVRTGVLLYSTLARARLNGRVSEQRALRLVPQLRTEGLHSSALYADARTNDGRLTIENVSAAAARGAVVLNYAEVVEIRGDGADVRVDGNVVRVRAAATVNASGPWLDHLRRLEDPAARPSIRLSKGVHVLVEGGGAWGAAVTIPQSKVRVSFAIPWEGMLLLGTTDTLHEGGPEEATVTDEDVRTILDEARVAVDGIEGPARAAFCGLRVLPGGPGSTANARRETVYSRGPTGMLSVAGGKLTTYRRIALDALAELGVRNLDRRPRPLPGAAGLASVRWPVELDPHVRSHLLHLYGSRAVDVLRPALDDPALLEPLVPGRPDLRAQAVFAREHEWARTEEDVLRRRTTGWLASDGDPPASQLGSGHVSQLDTADPAARS